MNNVQLYLASNSPRRQQLLDQLGVRYAILPQNIDESRYGNEVAVSYVERLALAKAETAWNHPERTSDVPLLAADTIVAINDQLLGKPKNAVTARQMLCQLSGQRHQVISAVAMMNETKRHVTVITTDVVIRKLSDKEITSYIATGEPLDKAGGYAIQGKAAIFVERIEGSYSAVMGLPLFETGNLLQQFGIEILIECN